MSVVNILNIQVLDNPTKFLNPFQFEITFECISPLKEDLEWKIIYVGSAEDDRYDQVLDSIMVGPIPVGINKFVFQTESPNPSLIPETDLVGVTVVLIVCSYNEQEFVRVGYYVNNEYEDLELRENPPEKVDLSIVTRNILSEKPRVTRVPIKWDNLDENPEPIQEDEGANYGDFSENANCDNFTGNIADNFNGNFNGNFTENVNCDNLTEATKLQDLNDSSQVEMQV